MAEGRSRQEWSHTSTILAMLANTHRDPRKSRPFKPRDFDPYARIDQRDEAIAIDDLGVLKQAFMQMRR
ncbi:MAG: hypothetical protein IT442_11365 [Phycisphaeraceae bacterium]|nr:hypothetical protein [Phycisphaeraceae bacterium]